MSKSVMWLCSKRKLVVTHTKGCKPKQQRILLLSIHPYLTMIRIPSGWTNITDYKISMTGCLLLPNHLFSHRWPQNRNVCKKEDVQFPRQTNSFLAQIKSSSNLCPCTVRRFQFVFLVRMKNPYIGLEILKSPMFMSKVVSTSPLLELLKSSPSDSENWCITDGAAVRWPGSYDGCWQAGNDVDKSTTLAGVTLWVWRGDAGQVWRAGDHSSQKSPTSWSLITGYRRIHLWGERVGWTIWKISVKALDRTGSRRQIFEIIAWIVVL